MAQSKSADDVLEPFKQMIFVGLHSTVQILNAVSRDYSDTWLVTSSIVSVRHTAF